jgi:glutamyl endopeptidase
MKSVNQTARAVLRTFAVMPALLVSAYAAEDPSTFVLSDGRMGLAGMAASAEGGVMPNAGTGRLSNDAIAEALRAIILSPEEIRALKPAGGFGAESLVGVDTRVRVYPNTYPYRAIALITSSGGSCTGWFIGADILATAGHCVHTGGPGGRFYTNVTVYPGYNAGGPGYAAQFLGTVVGWANSSNEEYDYGIVDIGSNVGSSTGWFGFWWQAAGLNNTPAVIPGYPGDKGSTTQWVGVDHVRVTQVRQVFYKADTFGGQSGSPIWHDRPAGSSFCSNGPCAYGIHAYGFPHKGAPHNNHNHGTRITKEVFNNLVNWRNTLP